jgi:hypothetical protein
MRDGLRYALAVLGYIGLSFLTKKFLNWTAGPIYFLFVLEFLPRAVDRVRRRWPRASPLEVEVVEP